MNITYRSTLTVYLLIMLSGPCHSHSSFTVEYDPSTNHDVLESNSKSFSEAPYSNSFSSMSLITEDGVASLFVVCRNDTIVQLSTDTLQMANIFRKSGCSDPQKEGCEQSVTINLLSEIELLNKKMMFFCYVISGSTLSGCLAPKNLVISNDVIWSRDGFSSTRTSYRTFAVQSKPHIFIGSYNMNSLMILRTMMPSVLGNIDTRDTLLTPKEDAYFARNSHFIEVFATKFEVYYVLVEPVIPNREGKYSDSITTTVSRLIRICRDDPGRSMEEIHDNFATTAKADIICSVGPESERYDYTRAIGASWSGRHLYVLFESQKNSPPGKVLCVYDESSFNYAFNSEIMNPQSQPEEFSEPPKKNPVNDVCKKLTERSLNDDEKPYVKVLSMVGLYRFRKVEPIPKKPLMNLRNLPYNSISTFTLNNIDPTTVIALIGNNFIRLLSHAENSSICFLQDLQFRRNERISQVKGHNIKEQVFLHISTDQRVVQFQLTKCHKYINQLECHNKAPNICGWDHRKRRCTVLSENIDPGQWQRSQCVHILLNDTWSLPEQCTMRSEKGPSSCTCQYCLNENGCGDEGRVRITDCVDSFNVDTHGQWSPWSTCSFQRRSKECKTGECLKNIFNYRECHYLSTSASASRWTGWYKTLNTKYHVSFRAKCPVNKLLPPAIEEREMICGESCKDKTNQWGTWSECLDSSIQYRLLNCSSFEECPHTKNEVRSCTPTVRAQKTSKGEQQGDYSLIHIVLAILVASLVWLIILVTVTLCFFRYKSSHKGKSKRPEREGKMQSKRKTALFDASSFMQQKSFVSVNSNDYLSRDLPSSCYNTSLSSTIPSDHTYHSSKTFHSIIPLLNENQQNTSDD